MKVDSIRIGYVDVPIHLENLYDADCFGYFEAYPTPKIGLHIGLTPLYMAATALHEIIEAISAFYGLDLTESQVRVLEAVIVEMVKRNPDQAAKWLDSVTKKPKEKG